MRKERVMNSFIGEVKKFIGKEVKVVFFNPNNEEDDFLSGVCQEIDYVQRSVILRTEYEKILIPRYKYIIRLRKSEPVKDDSVGEE